MRLAELFEEVSGELHLVRPYVATSNLIAVPVDRGCVFRQSLEGIEQIHIVEVEDVAHDFAKNSGRPTSEHPEFHHRTRDASDRHEFERALVGLLVNTPSP